MSLTSIASNPELNDPEQLYQWAFSHAQHHRDINNTIYLTTGISLGNGHLDPIKTNDMDNWLFTHQQVHNTINQIFGLSGQDLSITDWNNSVAKQEWVWQNLQEHLAFTSILGI